MSWVARAATPRDAAAEHAPDDAIEILAVTDIETKAGAAGGAKVVDEFRVLNNTIIDEQLKPYTSGAKASGALYMPDPRVCARAAGGDWRAASRCSVAATARGACCVCSATWPRWQRSARAVWWTVPAVVGRRESDEERATGATRMRQRSCMCCPACLRAHSTARSTHGAPRHASRQC